MEQQLFPLAWTSLLCRATLPRALKKEGTLLKQSLLKLIFYGTKTFIHMNMYTFHFLKKQSTLLNWKSSTVNFKVVIAI